MHSLTVMLLRWFFFLSFVHSESSDDISLSPRQLETRGEKTVMIGYYLNLYLEAFKPADLPWSSYTDMVYFGARPTSSFSVTFKPNDYDEPSVQNMQEFVTIATQKKVRAYLGVGGEQGSTLFSYYMHSKELREGFVAGIVAIAQDFGFVGVAISWEFPNDIGIGCNIRSAYDVDNLGLFAEEFKMQWSEGRLIIRSGLRGFVGAAGKVSTTNETRELAKHADYIDLIAYDAFTGNKGKKSGPFSLLTSNCGSYSFPVNGIKEAVGALMTQGFPATKIILGFAGYGRLFYIPKDFKVETGISQITAGVAPQGGWIDFLNGTRDACGRVRGYEGIYLLQELVANKWITEDTKEAGFGLQRGYNECAQQPYLFDSKWILVYDDVQSVKAKAEYAKSVNLGGLSIFDINGFADVIYQHGIVASGYGRKHSNSGKM